MEIKAYVRRAHYHETDQMGMVHHSNYARWMEEARVDLMDQIGMTYKSMEEAGVYSPVRKMSFQFKKMVLFDDVVKIRMKLVEYNGIIIRINYRIVDAQTGELRALAESEHCFLTKEGRPMNLKKTHPDMDACFESILNVESV